MIVENCRKKSPVCVARDPLFFSLVDYRNNYFISSNPDKIIEFYNGFKDRDQLIQWMNERPKGVANIHEVDGDKDIIVVIPTADYNGKYARECRDNIFKGLHIIFVESGEIPDPYFNYAHNCNVGIKKAMEYNPKWIVVSNDDMIKIDDVENLKKELLEINPNEYDILFAKDRPYITQISKLAEKRLIFKLLFSLTTKKFEWNKFERKFGIKYKGAPGKGSRSFLYKRGTKFRNFIAFAIFSIDFCRTLGGNIFDDFYLNAAEDTDLSIMAVTEYTSKSINFEISAFKGKTMGMDEIRRFKEIPSNAYLNFKIESGKLKIGNLGHNLKKS